jgi:aspartate/methionine/tyrosine aminotransferase
LPDFALETYFSRWEFVAKHHLTASDAESMELDALLELEGDGARSRFAELSLGYIPTWGTDELRAAIASSYERCSADDVLTFAGAGEALFWSCQLFLEAGDHAVCTVPNYQSIESVPRSAGARLSGFPLWAQRADGAVAWCLDLDRFASLLRPETQLVAVNFPNNPTGFVPDAASWVALLELCHERGILVISDEVYRGVELDAERTLPQACDVTPSALSINVLSKAYGLPGLRLGWAACRNRTTLERLERAKHYTSICNAAPSEFLGTIALRHRETILERNRDILRANLPIVASFMADHTELFRYQPPDGGCVAFPRYLGADGVDAFCERAVTESGVLLLPGSIYQSELAAIPPDHFRIGLGRRDVPAGIEQLARHLTQR